MELLQLVEGVVCEGGVFCVAIVDLLLGCLLNSHKLNEIASTGLATYREVNKNEISHHFFVFWSKIYCFVIQHKIPVCTY